VYFLHYILRRNNITFHKEFYNFVKITYILLIFLAVNQQEVLMDSQMMISSSKVLKTCTISLTKKMNDYDCIDFAQKLVYLLKSAIIYL